jgi:hypothetical protein
MSEGGAAPGRLDAFSSTHPPLKWSAILCRPAERDYDDELTYTGEKAHAFQSGWRNKNWLKGEGIPKRLA